ncbi:T9SS type A sorting domain-containing protein [Flavobacterium polysaccharolyticum]|uniref:T9SS type A sorting domain-containing protein n=1 Tax=Flavobacterium polysaccharolyticum TaxID=3133148 RepID=A0ABU9NLE1_9FLAO
MVKNYSYIILLLVLFFSVRVSAQETKQQPKTQENTSIEGLSLYPNPVSNGKVYISTKEDSEKEITIFDVLGKKVLQTQLSSRELNVSSLSPGVYIIKINENQATATRKLIIR